MAKNDCSVTVNFLRERERMCDSPFCGDGCPVNRLAREDRVSCGYYMRKHPEFAVEIVQKWSDEHPTKTRLDDLLEKYPGVVVESNGDPMFYPAALGYCNNCNLCRYGDGDTLKRCWHEPLVGGATGKAVE